MSPGAVKADPPLLASEAGAISMFGDRRLIWIDPAGEDVVEGDEALLEAPAVESPVAAIAGALRKTSALLKLAEAHGAGLAHAFYSPEGPDAHPMVVEAGLGIAYRAKPALAQVADARIDNNDLTALLWAQGIPRREWVEA